MDGQAEPGVVFRLDEAGTKWPLIDFSYARQFLDNVRDPEIWKMTKNGAQKVGGMSLGLLTDVAKAAIKVEVKKHTGFDLG